MIKELFKKLTTKGSALGSQSTAQHDSICKKVAFTLAEVLITLAIIGVVAAMTIPNLIQKTNEQITVKKVQKAYSIITQAYQYAVEEYGVPSTWGASRDATPPANAQSYQPNGAITLRDKFIKNIKISQVCNNSLDMTKCGAVKEIYYLNGRKEHTKQLSSAQIFDGFTLYFHPSPNGNAFVRGTTKALKNVFGTIFVDVNGINPPNTYGKDVFLFWITDYGVIPTGTKEETSYPFHIYCKNNNQGGSCAAWIIQQKNMKYLHSNKCSWENTSCK